MMIAVRGRAVWGRGATVVALLASLVACGGREVTLPPLDSVPPPPFATMPDDLADSPQLEAVPLRDTAGLLPDDVSAATELLAPALDRVAREAPTATTFNRISIYDDDVFVTWLDPANPSRSISASYYGSDDSFYVSEPRFDDQPGFTIDGLDPEVPTRLRVAIESRFPQLLVTSVDLRVGTSYGFGLVWDLELTDARGTLASVFADLDGEIVAVDTW